MSAKFLLLLGLLAAAGVQAAPLSYKNTMLTVTADCNKSKNPTCHQLTVSYPKTGDKALDAWALQAVKKSVCTHNLSAPALKAFLAKDEVLRETNKMNRERRKSPCYLSYVRSMELEGQTPNYAVFGEEVWEYTCGVHGNGTHTLSVLKRGTANPQPVPLQDILLPGKKDKLVQLQKNGYVKYLMKKYFPSAKEALDYANGYNKEGFKGTDNWRFAKGGLVFFFQSYEIGAYVIGTPEIYIPAKDLNGIVKPEILREAARYQINPRILKENKNAR